MMHLIYHLSAAWHARTRTRPSDGIIFILRMPASVTHKRSNTYYVMCVYGVSYCIAVSNV